MNKSKIILITATILIIMGGGVLVILSSSEDPLAQSATQQSSGIDRATAQQTDQQATGNEEYIIPGYVEYDPVTVTATTGTRVIFFHASWCPICTALDKNILEEGVPEGLTIFKANYDTDKELRKRYGVSVVSSLVQIDDSENLVKKWSGSLKIQQVVDELI